MPVARHFLRAADIQVLDRIGRARAVNEWAESWPGPRRTEAPAPDWLVAAVSRHVDRLTTTDLEDIAALIHAELDIRED